jgi:8-oxo-dGTP pyrophosphatase MutT (NUDIX family)
MTPVQAARREALEQLAREADRIVTLILHTSMPRVDIEIQIQNLREEFLRRYPETADLFEMVYASRFRRIWDQWEADRPGEGEPWQTAWKDY